MEEVKEAVDEDSESVYDFNRSLRHNFSESVKEKSKHPIHSPRTLMHLQTQKIRNVMEPLESRLASLQDEDSLVPLPSNEFAKIDLSNIKSTIRTQFDNSPDRNIEEKRTPKVTLDVSNKSENSSSQLSEHFADSTPKIDL